LGVAAFAIKAQGAKVQEANFPACTAGLNLRKKQPAIFAIRPFQITPTHGHTPIPGKTTTKRNDLI
jgi:hypothetical protein